MQKYNGRSSFREVSRATKGGTSKYDYLIYVIRNNEHRVIALIMEAVSTFETSVNLYQTTQRNIPEDSHLPNFLYVVSSVQAIIKFL
jgi:hypothetical protein